jgi:hypothetical protein
MTEREFCGEQERYVTPEAHTEYHVPAHLTSECADRTAIDGGCRDWLCRQAVKRDPTTGRYFITMGHAGFNSRANNGAGYTTEGGAARAVRALVSR